MCIHGVASHQIERPRVYTQRYVAERINGGEVSKALVIKPLIGERGGDRRLVTFIVVIQKLYLQSGVAGFRACPMTWLVGRRSQANIAALNYVLEA